MHIFDVMVKRAAIINPKVAKPPKLNAKMPAVAKPGQIALPKVTGSKSTASIPLETKVKDLKTTPKTIKGTAPTVKNPFVLKQVPNWGTQAFLKGVRK